MCCFQIICNTLKKKFRSTSKIVEWEKKKEGKENKYRLRVLVECGVNL